MTAYDQIQYPGYSHSQTHPDQLATKATLFGMTPAPAGRCRVLELGCGSGVNLASMALGLPESEFTGIDLAATAIAHGKEMAGAVGLKNLQLEVRSVMDIDVSFGEFDYIIAHGLYSWVPGPVREKVLAICQANLAPQGVAYVSYNANPGGHFKLMLREMMQYHTKGFADPKERVHQSIALVKFLAESQTKAEPYRRFLQEELENLLQRDPNNIFHDELGEVNSASTFQEFCDLARHHSLQYLAEGDYVLMQDSGFAPPVREALSQLGRNRIAREQYLDFLSFRRFRQTLLCRSDLKLRLGMNPESLARFHVSFAAKPESAAPLPDSNAAEKFVGDKNANVEVSNPLVKAALRILAEAWPQALPFTDLISNARTQLGLPTVDAAADADSLALFELFLQTYAPGLTTLHLHPPQFTPRASERPVASPLARWQAKTHERLTNLCHTLVVLEHPSGRHLLTLLDGTRDHATLAREMHGFAESARAESDTKKPIPSLEELSKNLETTLDVLARCALLCA